ncbi:Helix-loop-helix DNA-binding domain family protein [Acanthocheilonema viteae]
MLRVDAEKLDSEQKKILTKKANKPLMERKRRARINKCLFEMKQMLVDDVKNGSLNHSKWEKADILEMSVAYIRQLKRRIAANNKTKQAFSLPYFVDGFSDCVREMQNYTLLEKWPDDFREYNNRLTSHLNARLQLLISEPVMKYHRMSVSFPWDHTDENSVRHSNPACNSYQTIIHPSTFQILNHTTSVGCMTGTSSIKANLEVKAEADYCGKTSLFHGSKFSDHCMTNQESTMTTCDGYRLWRPF